MVSDNLSRQPFPLKVSKEEKYDGICVDCLKLNDADVDTRIFATESRFVRRSKRGAPRSRSRTFFRTMTSAPIFFF